jgi:DNA-binding CsgD family transcriptional regulator
VGGDDLWAAGEEHADAGRLASAALCWALTPSRLDDARLARLEELHDATHLPLLGPAVRLHRALAHGTHDELLTAAGTLRTRGPLALVAVRTAQERARAMGAPPLGAADVDRLVGAHPGRASRADDAELTRREAEIVALARDGLTNREIASRLFVSVRTVESHLYRAMQKLGVSQRSDLG